MTIRFFGLLALGYIANALAVFGIAFAAYRMFAFVAKLRIPKIPLAIKRTLAVCISGVLVFFLLRGLWIIQLNLVNSQLIEVIGEVPSPDRRMVLTVYETWGLWMGTGSYTLFNLHAMGTSLPLQKRSLLTGKWNPQPPGDVLELETTKRDYGIIWVDNNHLKIRIGKDPWSTSTMDVSYLLKKPKWGEISIEYASPDSAPLAGEALIRYRPLTLKEFE